MLANCFENRCNIMFAAVLAESRCASLCCPYWVVLRMRSVATFPGYFTFCPLDFPEALSRSSLFVSYV